MRDEREGTALWKKVASWLAVAAELQLEVVEGRYKVKAYERKPFIYAHMILELDS